MRHCWLWFVALLGLLFLSACASSKANSKAMHSSTAAAKESMLAAPMEAEKMPMDEYSAHEDSEGSDGEADVRQAEMEERGNTEPVSTLDERLFVYHGKVVVAVSNVEASVEKAQELAVKFDGYMESRREGSITIRVPARRFDAVMKEIMGLGDVRQREIDLTDVTEHYRDLELRLRNARRTHERLSQLLAKADKVEDAIKVEQELGRLSEQIERLEGMLKRLRSRVQYSTIRVYFESRYYDRADDYIVRFPFGWLSELGLARLLKLD